VQPSDDRLPAFDGLVGIPSHMQVLQVIGDYPDVDLIEGQPACVKKVEIARSLPRPRPSLPERRDQARAVILTVDRAGPTGETVELLRSSGYWERLVGAADDPNSDPCKLVIAVTKVDDVASEEYRNSQDLTPRPKKREIYARLVTEFKLRMKAQITEQLESISGSTNPALEQARSKARATILNDLEIHPVSAPEYRKLLLEDEDDRAFLRSW